MKIVVHRDGAQFGPYSLEEVRTALARGELRADDLAWQEGAADWVPLGSLLGLTQGNPAQIQASMGRGSATSGLAITSLILGILSFGCSFFAGVPALICGFVSLSQIKQSKGSLEGRGLAIGGIITGIVGLVFGLLLMISIAIPAIDAAKQAQRSAKSQLQIKQIFMACRGYASDHGGRYPNALDELVPDYLQDQKGLADPGQNDDTEIGYFYYGTGHFQTESNSNFFLMSKKAYRKGVRSVAHFDGTCDVEAATPPMEK